MTWYLRDRIRYEEKRCRFLNAEIAGRVKFKLEESCKKEFTLQSNNDIFRDTSIEGYEGLGCR